MTELDELKAKWEEQNRQLEQSVRLNRELLSATKLKAAESELRWAGIYAGLEAGIWLMVTLALGNFIAVHIRMLGLALSAAVADVMSVAMTIALIRRMIGALHIDYSQPVAAIQKQVEALLVLRIRTTQWGVLCGALLWVPWLAVALQVIFGFDLYRSADTAWLIVNGLFGLALFPTALWVSRKYGNRWDRSPFIQRFTKDLAGNNLNAAQTFLRRMREFEKE